MNLSPLLDTDDLFVPDFFQNIYRVLPTALRCIKAPIPRDDLFDIPCVLKHLKSNNALNTKRVIVCIVDSLGVQNFRGTELSAFFEDLNGITLSSTFPSITSSAIPSINFGLPPSEHGILGHVIYFKEYNALIDTLKMSGANTRWRDAIAAAGIDVKTLLWAPGIPDLLTRQHPGLIQAVGLPREIPGTGLGRFYILKENIFTYNGFIDAFGMVHRVLNEYPSSPLFATLYFPLIDTLAHKYGAFSIEYRAGCNAFYQQLRTFIEQLPSSVVKTTTIFLCSDHGQNPLQDGRSIIITQEELNEIKGTLKIPPGHSGRVTHFYCRSASKRRQLRNWLLERIEDKAILLNPKELNQSKLLPKPVTRRVIQRLGDLLLIGRSGVSLRVERKDSATESIGLLPWPGLLSSHGSLTKDELFTPLLAFRADTV